MNGAFQQFATSRLVCVVPDEVAIGLESRRHAFRGSRVLAIVGDEDLYLALHFEPVGHYEDSRGGLREIETLHDSESVYIETPLADSHSLVLLRARELQVERAVGERPAQVSGLEIDVKEPALLKPVWITRALLERSGRLHPPGD